MCIPSSRWLMLTTQVILRSGSSRPTSVEIEQTLNQVLLLVSSINPQFEFIENGQNWLVLCMKDNQFFTDAHYENPNSLLSCLSYNTHDQPNEIWLMPPGGACTLTEVFAPAPAASPVDAAGTVTGVSFLVSSCAWGTGTAAAPLLMPLPPNLSLSASGSLPKMLWFCVPPGWWWTLTEVIPYPCLLCSIYLYSIYN